jgi:hypothetical protein
MLACLQKEEDRTDVSFENNLTSTRSDFSDDDRSNNDEFEYLVSREDALERSRRRARNGDTFQSLPTNCKLLIRALDVPLNDDKGGPGVQLNKKNISKSMPLGIIMTKMH